MSENAPSGGAEGAVALVTGASRGFGRAVAERLGAAGAQVVAVARTVGGLEELDDAISAAGGKRAVLAPLDVTDGDGLDRLCHALYQRFGRLDILVHAAAHSVSLTPIAHLRPKDLETLTAVNLVATARLIRAADQLLRLAPAPVACFIADRKTAKPYWAGYAATKAAAEAMVAAYAVEAARAVRVELYEPPAMPTALRARTHPGEDRAALTPVGAAADAMLAHLGLVES